jgi:predicted RNA-binding Zn-ribbon protein involved in translation (DUF1610 family)
MRKTTKDFGFCCRSCGSVPKSKDIVTGPLGKDWDCPDCGTFHPLPYVSDEFDKVLDLPLLDGFKKVS